MTDEEKAVEQEENLDEKQEEELSEEEKLMAKLKEAIVVEKEDIGSLRLKLKVTVPRDLLDERMGEQFLELKRETVVPGFRKGRAPMRLVEKRFATDVGDQVVNQLVSNGYLAAVEKEDIKPLGDPLVWTKVREERITGGGGTRKAEVDKLLPVDEAAEHIKIPKEGDLTFACEINLKPQFDLPELEKIPLKKAAVNVKKEQVDQEIDRLRSYQGAFQPVEDGTVEADDLLFADVKLTVDGEAAISEENFDLPARDTLVKGCKLEGFKDAVVGKKIGEAVSIDVQVPVDHDNVAIRGKTGTFQATVREIKRFAKAEIDEAFLTAMGYESKKDLRTAVRAALEAQLDSMIRRNYHVQIKDYLLEKTALDLPEGLPQRLTEQTLARQKIELLRRDIPPDEVEKKVDEMRAEAEERTVRQMKLLFILEQVAEDREVTVTEEEINGAIAGIAARQNARFDRVRDELTKSGGMWNLYLELRDEKVLDALIGSAEVTEEEEKPAKKKPERKSPPKKAGSDKE